MICLTAFSVGMSYLHQQMVVHRNLKPSNGTLIWRW